MTVIFWSGSGAETCLLTSGATLAFLSNHGDRSIGGAAGGGRAATVHPLQPIG
jgi:hypothetical protein